LEEEGDADTEKLKIIPHSVAPISLPIVFGMVIEVACDLLRYVVRYFSTSIYFEVKLALWQQLKNLDLWIGFAFAVVLVGLSTWVLGAWQWADPRRWVRTGLLLISVILAGVLDPFGHIFREKLLEAYGKSMPTCSNS